MCGAPFMTLMDAMFDYDLRIADMDAAGVDLADVSLTTPNAYFGDAAVSLRAARQRLDGRAADAAPRPDPLVRLAAMACRGAAWPERACAAGAVGIMVIANIDGRNLTDPRFAKIWAEIDRRALPVLLHPERRRACAK